MPLFYEEIAMFICSGSVSEIGLGSHILLTCAWCKVMSFPQIYQFLFLNKHFCEDSNRKKIARKIYHPTLFCEIQCDLVDFSSRISLHEKIVNLKFDNLKVLASSFKKKIINKKIKNNKNVKLHRKCLSMWRPNYQSYLKNRAWVNYDKSVDG